MSNNEQPNESNRQRGQRLRREREQDEIKRQLVHQGKRLMVEQPECPLPSSSHSICRDIGPDTNDRSNRSNSQRRRRANEQVALSIPRSSDTGPSTSITLADTSGRSNRSNGQRQRRANEQAALSIPRSSYTGPSTSNPLAVDAPQLAHLRRLPRSFQTACPGSETFQMVDHHIPPIVGVTIFGKVDQGLMLAVELLRRHNVHVHIQTERHYNVIRINEETNRRSTGSEANNWMQVYDELQRINTSTLCDWRRPNQIIVHASWAHWKYVRIDTWAFLEVMRRKFGR